MAPAKLTIGELEAGYPSYCKALRLLIRDGTTLAMIKRTVCWQRLHLLHHCLPRQCRDPEMLVLHLRRASHQPVAPATGGADDP